MGRAGSLATAGLLASAVTATASSRPAILQPRKDGTTPTVTFDDIVPSPELHWTDCYDTNIQCAYLTVPLDYENPAAGTIDIAFSRYLLSEDAEDLLFNPGGPGESGIDFVTSGGETYTKQWGYNFVSFDPRGVQWSGPTISCTPGKNQTKSRRRRDVDALGDLTKSWNETLTKNEACSAANEHTDAKYVGTSAVVQDMMHFVELQAAARGKDPKTAHINYYGVSYGTLVGQTLVAMYPDRLRRVLLDGNVYGVAHYQGWEPSGIDDFAHGIWMFAKLCYEAGPEWCILAENCKSIDDVQARFDGVLAKLKANPINEGDVAFGPNEFLGQVQGWMYAPRQDFKKIATTTWAIDTGNLSAITGSAEKLKRDAPPKTGDELSIITAVDIAGRYPWNTYEEWKAAAERLEATAPYYAELYSTSNGLIGLAMNAFVPPSSQYFPGFSAIKTSAPVLFVNTAGDPVTPMSSAHQMSRLFDGSAVFIQNSPGHGYSTAPSNCTANILAHYFNDASLPAPGTWCEPDVEAEYYFGG